MWLKRLWTRLWESPSTPAEPSVTPPPAAPSAATPPAASPATPAPPADGSLDAVLAQARALLLADGPEAALRRLRDSPYATTDAARRLMHAWVWTHARKLPDSVLAEAFLDPVWCQCDMCDVTWLISPRQASLDVASPERIGGQCPDCHRVMCVTCAQRARGVCVCGAHVTTLRQPNGRHRRLKPGHSSQAVYEPPAEETRVGADPFLHLDFGYGGKVPVGVDPAFPRRLVDDPAAHARYAEALLDAGLPTLARQQLDLLPEASAASARLCWLRARLELVRLRNAWERERRHLNSYSGERFNSSHALTQVQDWLARATEGSDPYAPAWLTRAQVYLDPACGPDASAALAYAEQAHASLGPTPAIHLALAQALRGLDRPAEALEHLRAIELDAPEYAVAQTEIEWADLEARCQREPVDIAAHLSLGRRHIRHNHKERARPLFGQLLVEYPDRAEGYWGAAYLALLGDDLAALGDGPTGVAPLLAYSLNYGDLQTGRYARIYELCQEALKRDRGFGLAYEVLGILSHNLGHQRVKFPFPLEEPAALFDRAVRLDPSCDGALASLGQYCLEQGEVDQGVAYLEQAAALDTGRAQVYSLLAVVYEARRDIPRWEWADRQARDLSPNTSLAQDYKSRLLEKCGFEY